MGFGRTIIRSKDNTIGRMEIHMSGNIRMIYLMERVD